MIIMLYQILSVPVHLAVMYHIEIFALFYCDLCSHSTHNVKKKKRVEIAAQFDLKYQVVANLRMEKSFNN